MTSPDIANMTPKQNDWFRRMSAEMDAVRDAWCHDRTLAYRLYTKEIAFKIEEAARRLGIVLAQAWDMDGWDGEEDANIITTERQLAAVKAKFTGHEIPPYWFETPLEYIQSVEAKRTSRR